MTLTRPFVLVIALLSIAIMLPARADAVTIVDRYDRPHSHSFVKKAHRWIERSRVSIPADLQFKLIMRSCPAKTYNPPACAARGAIIWIGPQGRTREIFLHELGHILEPLLPAHTKRLLLRDMRAGSTGWDELYHNNTRPSEWLADYFAQCAMFGPKTSWTAGGWVIYAGPYGKPEITTKAYARICNRLDRVYKRADVSQLPKINYPTDRD